MLLAKTLLVVHGLMSLVYGTLVFLNPSSLAEYMGLSIFTDDGKAELLAMYVGMSGAISCFMLYAVFSSRWLSQAILFLAVFLTGVATGRTAGFLLFDTSTYTLGALAYDIPASLLSWVAVSKTQRAHAAHSGS